MRKEPYLTDENREEKVEQWLSTIDRKRTWGPGMGKTALLILDMQKFFTEEKSHAFIPSSRTIIPVISTIVEMFDGPILLTRHIQPDDDSNLMTHWWKDRIEGEGSELHPLIAEIGGEVMFKEHYSAFRNTGLHQYLQQKGVRSLIITGVMTDLCCETTAREAFMHGYRIYLIADGTATATEERHKAALRSISIGFGEVISSKELKSLL
jgi:nicotinamidase-related amidase